MTTERIWRMNLEEFAALWFVRKRLALPGDNAERATHDRPLPTGDMKALAQAIADRLNGAQLRPGAPNASVITVDSAQLVAESGGWDTLFEARDSVLKVVNAIPTDPKTTLAGFLVLRWIFAESGVLIAQYPTVNPPLTGGELEKRTLARVLASRLDDAGLTLNKPKDFLNGSKAWGRRFDAMEAVLDHVD